MNFLRRLWCAFFGTSSTYRTITYHSSDQVDQIDFLRVDWSSREWTREDGTMEREVWDAKTGSITNYVSADHGKTWALIP